MADDTARLELVVDERTGRIRPHLNGVRIAGVREVIVHSSPRDLGEVSITLLTRACDFTSNAPVDPTPEEPPARDVDAIGFPLDRTPPADVPVPDEMRAGSPWQKPEHSGWSG